MVSLEVETKEVKEVKTKKCDMCCKELPRENFSKNVHSEDGLQSRCKYCTKEYGKWRELNPSYSKKGIFRFNMTEVAYHFRKDVLGWTLEDFEEFDSPTVAMKHCNKCDRDLPFEEFSLSASSKDGHQPYCKSCYKEINEFHRERRIAEKEKLSHIAETYIALTKDAPADMTTNVDILIKFKELLTSLSINYFTFIKVLGIVNSTNFKEAVSLYDNFSTDVKHLADKLLK